MPDRAKFLIWVTKPRNPLAAKLKASNLIPNNIQRA
jgi:hypothetical protein